MNNFVFVVCRLIWTDAFSTSNAVLTEPLCCESWRACGIMKKSLCQSNAHKQRLWHFAQPFLPGRLGAYSKCCNNWHQFRQLWRRAFPAWICYSSSSQQSSLVTMETSCYGMYVALVADGEHWWCHWYRGIIECAFLFHVWHQNPDRGSGRVISGRSSKAIKQTCSYTARQDDGSKSLLEC